MTFSCLATLSISSLYLDIEVKSFMIDLIDFMMQHFLQDGVPNMLVDFILTLKLIMLGILSKIKLLTKRLNS